MANNRICLACGKAYEYCGSCENTRKLPVWKNLFDTESCKDIFECTSDYLQKAITKERAQKRLSACDLSKVSDMKDEIRKVAEEIIHEDKPETVKTVEPKGTTAKKVPKKKTVEKTESVD